MRSHLRCLTIIMAAAGSLCAAAFSAAARDIIILTAGAYKPVLLDLIPPYEARTGVHVEISNDTAGGVSARIGRGETVDLAILPAAGLEALTKSGKIAADSAVLLAKSGIGVVIKAGAPKPDISTVEAFKRTLLAAPSIAYIDPASGGSSGIYLAGLFQRMGIADEIRKKAVLVPGGLTASRVDNGEAALALQQVSELRAVRGVTQVGLLPGEIQNYTTYGGGIPASAANPADARALLQWLHGDVAIKALAAWGLEKP